MNIQPASCTLEASIAECERELAVRMRCYKKWVDDGKLTAFDASERADRLQSAIQHLRNYQQTLSTQNLPIMLDSMPMAATA